jgi:hypothetical protein
MCWEYSECIWEILSDLCCQKTNNFVLGTLRLWLSRRTKLWCTLDTHSKISVHRLHVWRLWPFLFKWDVSVLAHDAMQQLSGWTKAELQSLSSIFYHGCNPGTCSGPTGRSLTPSSLMVPFSAKVLIHFPPTHATKVNFVTKLQWRWTWYRWSCEVVNTNKSSQVQKGWQYQASISLWEIVSLLVKFTVGP